jgi:molybdenum cofactor cytidylyltransferase
MKRYKNIGDLFEEEPIQWGLRGDPFLWREMREYFSEAPIPNSVSQLEQKITQAFFDLTGHLMSGSKHFRVERLAHGGMSSGCISPEFWREKALPLIKNRHSISHP